MSTGTLKLASLLIVIAAGGGVAWQAQQGLLHPKSEQTSADETDPGSAADEDPFDEEVDLLAESAPPDDHPEPIRWREETTDAESPTPIEGARLASLPGKFERSQAKAKSPTPIPARSPTGEASSELRGDDPFAADSDPADNPSPLAMPTHIREADQPAEFGSDDTTEEPTAEPVADPGESSDPFSNDGPVMLVGGETDDLTEETPRPRRRSIAAEPEAQPAGEPGDAFSDDADPFADSAPPDFGDASAAPAKEAEERLMEEQPSRKPRGIPTLPTEVGDDPFGSEEPAPTHTPRRRSPSRDPQPEEPLADESRLTREPLVEEPPSVRAPRRRSPSLDSQSDEPLADETSSKPRQRNMDRNPEPVEAIPDLGSPSSELPDDSRDRSRSNRDLPPRSPRTRTLPEPDVGDEPPRLLPEPDEPEDLSETGFGDDPNPDAAMESDPPPREPRSTPRDEIVLPDDLDGDAMPNPTAPTGLQQPRLTIEKIAPKQAVLGQPLIYSVVVKNAGSADAHHVTVEDRIPKGTKLEGTAPRAELIEKTLVWKLGTLKPNEEKKISIKVIPQEKGPIGSVAKVNFVAEIAAETEVTAPQVQLSIDAPSQVRLGEKLKLTYKVRNRGRADAENVVLRNIIPDGLRHPAGDDLEYAIGTLAAGESRDITLDLIATKNGKVTNKTTITGDGGVSIEEETPVEIVGEQLLLTRTGKNKLYIDRAAIFTSTVANEGTAPATKVMVAEVIPLGFEFVSASDQGRYDPNTRAVTWSVGPIEPGDELKLSTKLLPKKEGDYRATVTVTGPAGGVASVEADLQVDGFPAVAVEAKSDTRLIGVGEKATIRITCKNQGTSAAKNTILSAVLPPELKLVDAQGPSVWAEDGNVVTFEAVPSIPATEIATYELQVEGVGEGDARIELQMTADHLKRPLTRDEPLRVAPAN